MKKHNGAVEYLYVDIDTHKELAQMLQIQSIPIMYMVRNGELIEKMSGLQQGKALEDFIQKGLDAGSKWLI